MSMPVEDADDVPWVEAENPNLFMDYLRTLDQKMMLTREGRIALTITDPLAFALIYLPHHLKNSRGEMTLAGVHLDWVRLAKRWINPGPRRDAMVAPRNTGKSTWHFLILPMWAAAHGHVKFAAAFADSGTQAEEHLKSFKSELDNNKLLREDFPELVVPARRERGQAVSDNRNMIVQKNGFAFSAKGIDSSSLGLKVGNQRPDLIIFDDIEPDEASYSAYQAGRRRGTVTDAILPMNFEATVVFVGTVTMAGGLMHQLVNSVTTKIAPEAWITDENIDVHYYEPIITHEDGTISSIWPEKWSIGYLKKNEHTRSYAKNFKNLPISGDGEYWTSEDFKYGKISGITKTIISIDPAVTTKKTSDFTGIANIAFRPMRRHGVNIEVQPKCLVQDAAQVKLSGDKLRTYVLRMIARSPTPVTLIYIESNQGGEAWLSVFHDMPCKVVLETKSIKKEVRATQLLNHYHRDRVQHLKQLTELEDQMMGYPDVLHDDMIDAVGNGVSYFAKSKKKGRVGATNVAYM